MHSLYSSSRCMGGGLLGRCIADVERAVHGTVDGVKLLCGLIFQPLAYHVSPADRQQQPCSLQKSKYAGLVEAKSWTAGQTLGQLDSSYTVMHSHLSSSSSSALAREVDSRGGA